MDKISSSVVNSGRRTAAHEPIGYQSIIICWSIRKYNNRFVAVKVEEGINSNFPLALCSWVRASAFPGTSINERKHTLIYVKMLSAVHLDSFSTSNCPTDLWNSRTVYFKYDIGVNLFLKTELEERRDCRILVVGLRRILMNSRVHNSCMRSLIGSILQITSNASADEGD